MTFDVECHSDQATQQLQQQWLHLSSDTANCITAEDKGLCNLGEISWGPEASDSGEEYGSFERSNRIIRPLYTGCWLCAAQLVYGMCLGSTICVFTLSSGPQRTLR